jgi:GDP-L-fucose synthase
MSGMDRNTRVFVSGHEGLVGSALVRRLVAEGYTSLLTATRAQLDLRDQAAVNDWFHVNRPEAVFLAAGTVGGILANSTRPAEFIYDNLMIQATVVHAAHLCGAKKLLYLGSSCIYPRESPQPIGEDALLKGPLEPTSEPYAVAKIAGIRLCQAYRAQYGAKFISAVPINVYGPNDNFDPRDSHVLPAMMKRFHDAKLEGERTVTIWGTGTPTREFLHVDDLADACLFLMDRYDDVSHVNVGTGEEVSISDVARLVAEVVYPAAELVFDRTKPDGTPRKRLDVSKLHSLGWKHKIPLRTGIESTYEWFLRQRSLSLRT